MAIETISESALLLGLILFSAKIGEDLSRRAGFPSYIGAIIAGILIGPAILDLVNPREAIHLQLFIILGIDFLLFIAGAEELSEVFSEKLKIKEILEGVFMLSGTIILTSITLYILGLSSLVQSIAIGIVMGIISVGPMIKVMLETGEISKPQGIKMVKIALLAETVGIILFNGLSENLIHLVVTIPITFIFVFILYIVGKNILPRLLHFIEHVSWAGEASFASIIALILTTGYLAEMLGFNAAVVSLMLGVFASSYLRERPDYMEKLKAFTYGFFEPLFFAGIGMYVTAITTGSLAISGLLVIVVITTKFSVGKYLFRNGKKQLFLLLSKGGVDAALLATMVNIRNTALLITNDLYSGGILAITILALVSVLPYRSTTPGSIRPNKSFWGQKVKNLNLQPIYTTVEDNLRKTATLLTEYPSLVVVKEREPIGYLTQSDLIYIDPETMEHLKVASLEPFKPVPIVRENSTVFEAMQKLHDAEANVVAVVDENGLIKGVLYARQILRAFSKEKLQKNKQAR